MSDKHKVLRDRSEALMRHLKFTNVNFLFGRCSRGPTSSVCMRVGAKSPLILEHGVVPGNPVVLEVMDEQHRKLGTLIMRAEKYAMVDYVLYSVSIYNKG